MLPPRRRGGQPSALRASLNPRYARDHSCPLCHGYGMVGTRRPDGGLDAPAFCTCAVGQRDRRRAEQDARRLAEEQRKNHRENLERALRFGARERDWTLESSPLADPASEGHDAWLAAKKFVRRFPLKPRNLLLLGVQPGAGKTGLLIGVLQALQDWAIKEQRMMRYRPMTEWFEYLQAGMRDGDYDERLLGCQKVAVLALDDVGISDNTRWRTEVLYEILNARYTGQHGGLREGAPFLPTFLTSNLTGDQLKEWLGNRLVSRLLHEADVIQVKGPDQRVGVVDLDEY